MRKIFVIILVIFISKSTFTHADTQMKVKVHDKTMDHLLLSMFNKEIHEEVDRYYKVDSLQIVYVPKEVEVLQEEKGVDLESPYVVKFTVQPQNNKRALGRDTIAFGIHFNKYSGRMVVKTLKYEHNELK